MLYAIPLKEKSSIALAGELITILVKSNFIGVVTRQLMAKKDISPLYSRSQKKTMSFYGIEKKT